MDYRLDIGGYQIKKKSCNRCGNLKLSVHDWMADLPETQKETDFVEVQFKNTRKGYYLNSTNIPLEKGDMVAVESSPGHDIGEVTLVGKLVLLQMKKNNVHPEKMEIRRIYRKAKDTDLQKYQEAKNKEHATMIQARQIAERMNLKMKIGDVEFQGDGNKAIFYYIAEERVDFRELIKVFAETFHVRIEMKQIGARQEAGRIGGIGPCGRELCCASWMTCFNSVATSSARCQDISLNPQKLAGQCSKLKCCMNYELDTYQEAMKEFPSKEIQLETFDNTYYHFKTDVFKGQISYSTAQNFGANIITISVKRAKEVIAMNKKGIKPEKLEDISESTSQQPVVQDFENVVGQESVTRFDDRKRKNSRFKNKNKKQKNSSNTNGQPASEHRIAKPIKKNEQNKENNDNDKK